MLQAKSSQPDMNGDLERAGPWPSIQHADDNFEGALSHDIQPCVQNSRNVYLSSLCGGAELSLPTSTWPEEGVSEFSSLMDDLDGRLCRWDHGVKPGGDKYNMSCGWDGCEKVMKKESISRHIIAVHLNNKSECASCGKQFARLDSKPRHPKKIQNERSAENLNPMIVVSNAADACCGPCSGLGCVQFIWKSDRCFPKKPGPPPAPSTTTTTLANRGGTGKY